MIYTVKKIYKYTEIVEVEAESERQALDLANITEGDVQNDDWLYDAEVIKGERNNEA